MHNCPECDDACDCDMEDHWNHYAPDDCSHECADEEDDDYFDEQYDDINHTMKQPLEPRW